MKLSNYINSEGIVEGIWITGMNEETLFIPFSLCICLADSLTFTDKDIIGTTELIGYIEAYHDYDGSVCLSDGSESVSIDKCEIDDFIKYLWNLI